MNDDTDTCLYDPDAVTKIDKMLHTLTDAQLAAVDALLTGADQETAASAAGVHRVTVNRWANHHPEFQAELNRRRRQLVDQQMDRVRHIDNLALENLMRRVQAGDESASELWLKMRGLAAFDTSKIWPTDSDAIIGKQVTKRLHQVNIEDIEAYMAAASPRSPKRDDIEQTIQIQIAEKLDECTLAEVLNSRWRRLLTDFDGNAEDNNGRASVP